MSRSIVRRLTAALALLVVLGLALPAGAATSRPRLAGTPVTLGSSLVDQILTWLGSFWPGQRPEAQGQTRTISPPLSQPGTNAASSSSNSDHSGMIDPNG